MDRSDREALAKRCLRLAEMLVGDERTAQMPSGRETGQMKSILKRLGKKHGWGMSKVFKERSFSGFVVYGTMEIEEQLADVGPGRVRSDLEKEMKADGKRLERELKTALRKLNPDDVTVTVNVGSAGGWDLVGRLGIYVQFGEGVPVTPLQIL